MIEEATKRLDFGSLRGTIGRRDPNSLLGFYAGRDGSGDNDEGNQETQRRHLRVLGTTHGNVLERSALRDQLLVAG